MQGSSTKQTGPHLDRDALLHEWGRVVADRRLHATEESAGTDIVPPLIGWLASQKELTVESTSFEPMVRDLAYARLEEGCPLRAIVGDCSMLRECILRVSTTELDPNSPEARQGTLAVHRWLDRAVAVVAAVYTEAKDRSFRGIDRVSAAFARSANVEELLQRLIDAFQDIGPRVDAVAIALTEDDHLRIYAASGVAEHLEGKALKLGDDFIGRLVAEKRSLALRFRDADPMALPQGMSRSGLRTIYGAPMIEGGEVLGVALMGSCTVFDFPNDERLVFDVMARHATSAIRSQKIRESLALETARMDALLASMPAGVFVADGPSAKMILHNHQAETVWRRSFPASMSLDARDEWVAYTRDGRRVEPEAWALSRAVRTGETVLNQEVDILRGDGTRGTILNSAAPILAEGTRIIGGVATFSDITEKRKTENQLQRALAQAQRAETFHRILAEAGQELAESVDKESALRAIANLAVPKLADYCGLFVADDRRRLTIRHFAAIDPVKAARLHEYQHANLERMQDDPEMLNPAMQVVLERGELKIFDHVTDEVLVNAAAGNERLLALLRGLGVTSAVMVPMIARGRSLGVAVFAQMTASRELLPGDVDLAEALTQCSALALDNHLLYRSAQEAAQQREEILAIVSHDLRSVLGAVQLNAELLATKPMPGDGRGRVDRIIYATQRMDRFIRDLLDSTAIAKGKLSIEKRPAAPASIVKSTVALFDESARRQGVALTIDVDETIPPILCDANRIGQVLENLISNALKATGPDGAICARLRPSGDGVVFSVVDTGAGMPAEVVDHLFERYYRGQGPRGQGLGLGLSIAKAIVNSHGGRIWAESSPGKGSTLAFTILPFASEGTGP